MAGGVANALVRLTFPAPPWDCPAARSWRGRQGGGGGALGDGTARTLGLACVAELPAHGA